MNYALIEVAMALLFFAVFPCRCARTTGPRAREGQGESGPEGEGHAPDRIAWDAFAPSKFVAVIDDFITLPLKLSWDLAKLEKQDQREAQTKQKKEFDDLIKKLEDKKINGVEFECKGEWLTKGYKLRVTTVPQPTEAGKKRIRDGGQ